MQHEWHIKELSIGGTGAVEGDPGSGGIDPTDTLGEDQFCGGVETIIEGEDWGFDFGGDGLLGGDGDGVGMEDDYGFIHADVLPSYADLFLPELGKMDDELPLVGDDDEVEDLYESAGHAGTVIISPFKFGIRTGTIDGGDPNGP